MSSQGRPRRADAERNRERVLASAEAVLARDGLPASMRAVAAHAGVGLGTIYRNFPTQEALYQAIIVQRTKALIAEAAELSAAQEPGRAFLGYFSRIVEHAARNKAMADLLVGAGIDPKPGLGDVSRDDMRRAVQTLLTRAQQAGAIRADLHMPELMALLTATCLAAEHSQWDTGLRTRTLAIVFDGMRPQPGRPSLPPFARHLSKGLRVGLGGEGRGVLAEHRRQVQHASGRGVDAVVEQREMKERGR
jgi:AcrR family transcriptional regulator